MVEVVEGLKVYTPADIDGLTRLATKFVMTRALQTDEMVRDPVGWAVREFTNPANLGFDVCDGAGFIGFLHTVPTWRAALYCVAWKREAMRRDDLLDVACKVAVTAKDLLVVDAFIDESNRLSIKAVERNGFTFRGTIKAAACYNGTVQPRRWYEKTRAEILGEGA